MNFFIRRVLKEIIPNATEIRISESSLGPLFVGSYTKVVKPIVEKVLERLRKENPESVLVRRNRSSVITVIINKEKFIELMLVEGARLKSSETKVKNSEFILSEPSIESVFENVYGKDFKLNLQEVIENIQEEELDLITNRKHGSNIVSVVTDRERFIQEMVKRGAKLREK